MRTARVPVFPFQMEFGNRGNVARTTGGFHPRLTSQSDSLKRLGSFLLITLGQTLSDTCWETHGQ
jgi:hypothetical protein